MRLKLKYFLEDAVLKEFTRVKAAPISSAVFVSAIRKSHFILWAFHLGVVFLCFGYNYVFFSAMETITRPVDLTKMPNVLTKI